MFLRIWVSIRVATESLSTDKPLWFDKLTANGSSPFVLSLSKDQERPPLELLASL
jgi:hypothetical protein